MPSRNIFENTEQENNPPCEHELTDGNVFAYVVGWQKWIKITGACNSCGEHMTVKFPMPQEMP